MSPSRTLDPQIAGDWDTHHHIFDAEQFPYSATRHLTPPKASIEQYQQWKLEMGITRSVLVHGLSYGHDCTSLKHFLKRLGPEVTRGVAVISRETTNEEIHDLYAHGVRGIRLDLYHENAMRDLQKQTAMLSWYAERIRLCNWSMAFLQLEPSHWEPLSNLIPTLPVNVVVDHHGLMKARSMLPQNVEVMQQPGMLSLVRLLQAGNFWLKLSAPYRCSEMAPDYEDMREIVRAFVDANPRRVLYRSDWPHTPRMTVRTQEEALTETQYLQVDDGAWLRSLRSWLSDEEWHLLMIDNPTALYGW